MDPVEKIWLLIAHGSRVAAANQEIRALAQGLSERLGQKILPAFLELAEPSIPAAIDLAATSRAGEIFLLPYFLTQGRHVREDIVAIVQTKSQQFPEISIQLLDYLGAHPGMEELLERIIEGRKNQGLLAGTPGGK